MLKSFDRIFLETTIKSFQEILDLYAQHPNLLIVQEAAWLVVESVFSEACAKIIFRFVDGGIVHIHDIGLVLFLNCKAQFL